VIIKNAKQDISNFIALSFQEYNSTLPNGPALSCGADNFQIAENETSSRW